MTATVEQLDERVTSLENRMDEQERLRAGQDRDLSDIAENVRAQGRLLKALSVTQSEHTQTLAEHTVKLDRLEHAVGELRVGMHQIVGKLDLLIERDGGR